MKRKVIVMGMLAFAFFALIAPQKAQAQYDFLREANWDGVFDNMLKKYSPSGLKPGDTWKCDNIRVIAQRPPNADRPDLKDPAKFGGLIQRDGTRRYPESKDSTGFITNFRGSGKGTEIVGFNATLSQPIAFVTFRDVEWYKPTAQTRLFLLQGELDINEDKTGHITGFTLKKGANLREDKTFKSNASYDEVMTMYSCVMDDPGWMKMDIKGIRAKYKNDGNKAADDVINRWAALAGGLGALGGAAPIWALPAEFAQTFVENGNKARLAWAVAQCYGRQRTGDEFKNDLYILFSDDDVGVTLKNIAKATGVAAAKDIPIEIISNEKVLTAIGTKVAGKKAVTEAVTKAVKTSGTAAKVEKQAVSKAKGAGKIIAFVTIAVKGSMAADEARKFGARAKQLYRD